MRLLMAASVQGPDQFRSLGVHLVVIAEARVERSLFALRDLDSADWQASRAAYADFALQDFRTMESAR